MLVFGDLIEQFDPEGSGQDNLGLGRWTFMKFSGGDGVVTQVICGCSLCSNKKRTQEHFINNINSI
jgi:hypothetical protein